MNLADAKVLTVSQLTRQVKGLLEETIGAVWISGEISNWKVAASGHAYFTLKDANSQIDAVMFKGSMNRLKFQPGNGLEVIAHGRVSVYEARGNYQIVLDDMQPKGLGALQLAYERLKKKLEEEGLFDPAHKKALPLLPRRIGIVTSPTGAAIRDILNVLARRFANAHIILYPVRVQGQGAATEIARGIRILDAWGVDVMIVGRGGGSLEDLWAFNEEPVVRAVFAANTPVISAVGHEIDFTLCDFVADLRAPTPSAAAELVVREFEQLLGQLNTLRRDMAKALQQRIERARHRLGSAQRSYYFQRPEELVRQRRLQFDDIQMRLQDQANARLVDARTRTQAATRALRLLSPAAQLKRARERLLLLRARLATEARRTASTTRDRKESLTRRLPTLGPAITQRGRARLATYGAQLEALSPLAILSRGYAIAWQLPQRTLLRSVESLNPGDEIEVRFGKGAARARVLECKENHNGEV